MLGTAHGSSDTQQLVPSKNAPEICHVGSLFSGSSLASQDRSNPLGHRSEPHESTFGPPETAPRTTKPAQNTAHTRTASGPLQDHFGTSLETAKHRSGLLKTSSTQDLLRTFLATLKESSPEQSAAVPRSREQYGEVRSNRDQWRAVLSSREQKGAADNSTVQNSVQDRSRPARGTSGSLGNHFGVVSWPPNSNFMLRRTARSQLGAASRTIQTSAKFTSTKIVHAMDGHALAYMHICVSAGRSAVLQFGDLERPKRL